MALSNAEKQARWRERHIKRRRDAQHVANLLTRRHWPDGDVEEIASALRVLLTSTGIAALRKALRNPTPGERKARHNEAIRQERAAWLQEHPGKTAKNYKQAMATEVFEWRRTKAKGEVAAEQQAWKQDHPGKKFPEHECGLSDREYTDLQRWRRERQRKRRHT
jgi:hypothetical protein